MPLLDGKKVLYLGKESEDYSSIMKKESSEMQNHRRDPKTEKLISLWKRF